MNLTSIFCAKTQSFEGALATGGERIDSTVKTEYRGLN